MGQLDLLQLGGFFNLRSPTGGVHMQLSMINSQPANLTSSLQASTSTWISVSVMLNSIPGYKQRICVGLQCVESADIRPLGLPLIGYTQLGSGSQGLKSWISMLEVYSRFLQRNEHMKTFFSPGYYYSQSDMPAQLLKFDFANDMIVDIYASSQWDTQQQRSVRVQASGMIQTYAQLDQFPDGQFYDEPATSQIGSLIMQGGTEVTLPVSQTGPLLSFTYEIWINNLKQTSNQGVFNILSLHAHDPATSKLHKFSQLAIKVSNSSHIEIFTGNIQRVSSTQAPKDAKLEVTLLFASYIAKWIHCSVSYTFQGDLLFILCDRAYNQVEALANKLNEYMLQDIKLGQPGNSGLPHQLLLREFRMWNVYLTPSDIQLMRRSDLTSLNHPNLVNYYKFDTSDAEGKVFENKATLYSFNGEHFVMAAPSNNVQYDTTSTHSLTLCKFGTYYTSGSCTPSGYYEKTYQYTPGVSLKVVNPKGKEAYIDFWIYFKEIEQVLDHNQYLVVASKPDQVYLQVVKGDKLECRNYNNNVYTQFKASEYKNKWIYIGIGTFNGNLGLQLHVNQVKCSRPQSLSAVQVSDLSLEIGDVSIGDKATMYVRDVKVWKMKQDRYIAQQIMNSTMFEPYINQQLLEYAPLRGDFDADTPFITGKLIKNEIQRLSISANSASKVVDLQYRKSFFCPLGMFKGVYPDYDSCYIPKPIARQNDVSNTQEQTFGVLPTNLISGEEFSIGLWVQFQKDSFGNHNIVKSNSPTNKFQIDRNSDEIRIVLNVQNHDFVDLVKDSRKGMWYQLIFIREPPNTITAYFIHQTYPKKVVSIPGTINKPTYTVTHIKLLHNSKKIHLRNLLFTSKKSYSYVISNLLMSTPMVNDVIRSAKHTTFMPYTSSDNLNMIIDGRGLKVERLDTSRRVWFVDQTFPYRVCDGRFQASDAMGTCGSPGELYTQDKGYEISYSQYPNGMTNIFSDGSKQINAGTSLSFYIWIFCEGNGESRQTKIFQTGNGAQQVNSLRNTFQSGKSQFQLTLDKNQNEFSSNIGPEMDEQVLIQKWIHLSLYKVGTMYYIQLNENEFKNQNEKVVKLFDNGDYVHQYSFGCVIAQGCFRGRLRDFMVVQEVQNIYGIYMMGSNIQLLQQRVIFYHSLKGRTSSSHVITPDDNLEPYTFVESGTTSTGATLPQNVLIQPQTQPRDPYKPRQVDATPYLIYDTDYTLSNYTVTKFEPKNSYGDFTCIIDFKVNHQLVGSNTLLIFDYVFKIEIDKFSQNSVRVHNLRYSKVVSNLNQPAGLNQDGWNQLILFLGNKVNGKKAVYLNSVEIIDQAQFTISEGSANLANNYKIEAKLHNIYLFEIFTYRRFMLINDNFRDQANFFLVYYQQLASTLTFPTYHTNRFGSGQEIILIDYNFIDEGNIHDSLSMQLNFYKYQDMQQKRIAGLRGNKVTDRKVMYCNGMQYYWDGNRCVDTNVLTFQTLDSQVSGYQRSRGLSLPVPGLSKKNHFVISFWVLVRKGSQQIKVFRLFKSGLNRVLNVYIDKASNLLRVHYISQTDLSSFGQDNSWNYMQFQFHANESFEVHMNGNQKFIPTHVTGGDDFKGFDDRIALGGTTTSKIAFKSLMLKDDILSDGSGHHVIWINEKVFSQWPLDKEGDGLWVQDHITHLKVSTVGIPWMTPTQLTGQPTFHITRCKPGQQVIPTSHECKSRSDLDYQFQARVTPVSLVMNNPVVVETTYTIELWVKPNFLTRSLLDTESLTYLDFQDGDLIVKQKGVGANQIQILTTSSGINDIYDFGGHKGNNRWHYYSFRKFNTNVCYICFDGSIHLINSLCGMKYLKSSINIKYSGSTIDSNQIRLGVRELRIWNDPLPDSILFSQMTSSLPPQTPSLVGQMRIHDGYIYNSLFPDVYQIQSPGLFAIVDKSTEPQLNLNCPQSEHYQLATQQCSGVKAYTSFTIPPGKQQIQIDFDSQMIDSHRLVDHSMSIAFNFKCAQPISQMHRIIHMQNRFKILLLTQSSIKVDLELISNKNHISPSPLILCGANEGFYTFLIQFNPIKAQVTYHVIRDTTYSYTFTNVYNNQYLTSSISTILLSNQNLDNVFIYQDLYLFYPYIPLSIVQAYKHTKSLDLSHYRSYGLVLDMRTQMNKAFMGYTDKGELFSTYLSEPIKQIDVIQNVLGEIMCPEGTVRNKYTKVCESYGALYLNGKAKVELSKPGYKIGQEVSMIVWARFERLPTTTEIIIELGGIFQLKLRTQAGQIFKLCTNRCDGSGTIECQYVQLLVPSPLNVWNLLTVQKTFDSTWIVGNQDGVSDKTKHECNDYSSTTITGLALMSETGAYQYQQLIILSRNVKYGEINYYKTHGISLVEQQRYILTYYQFYLRQETLTELVSGDMVQVSNTHTGKGSGDYINYRDGPLVSQYGQLLHSDGKRYIKSKKYLYFTGNQVLANPYKFQHLKQIRFKHQVTISFCSYQASTVQTNPYYILSLDGRFQVSRLRDLSGTNVARMILNSQYLNPNPYHFQQAKSLIKYDKWVCFAYGIKSEPNLKSESKLYQIHDSENFRIDTELGIVDTFDITIGKFIIGQTENYKGCECFLSQIKIFNTFIHPVNVQRQIMRHVVNQVKYSRMQIYMPLDEIGQRRLYNYVDGSSTYLQFPPPDSQYPQFRYLPTQLIHCQDDAKFWRATNGDGICTPHQRVALFNLKFNVPVQSTEHLQGTLGVWQLYVQSDSSFQIQFQISDRLQVSVFNNDTMQINDQSINVKLSKQILRHHINTRWIYTSIRYNRPYKLIHTLFYHTNLQQWDEHKYENTFITSPTSPIIKLCIKCSSNNKMVIKDIIYYTTALHPDTIKYRYNNPLMRTDLPSLIAYYPLQESYESEFMNHAVNVKFGSAQQLYFHRKIDSVKFKWMFENEFQTQQPAPGGFCMQKQVGLGNSCTRVRYNCSQCTSPYAIKECKGDPKIPSNCLVPKSAVYNHVTKEFNECFHLCETCTQGYEQRYCTKCIKGYTLNPSNICEPECPEGQAINSTASNNGVCSKCEKVNCNCGADDFGVCKSCMSSFVGYFIVDPVVGASCEPPPTGNQYYNPLMKRFETCHSSCARCIGAGSLSCTACKNSSISPSGSGGGSCTEVRCGPREFKDGQKCLICHKNCQSCTGSLSTQCIGCNRGYVFNSTSHTCINIPIQYQSQLILVGDSQVYEQVCNAAGIRLDGLDFVQNPPEYCNDGNLLDGDGCSSGCRVELGFECSGGNSTSPYVCVDESSPKARIVSISDSLEVLLHFSEAMNRTLSNIDTSKHLHLYISGPKDIYHLESKALPPVYPTNASSTSSTYLTIQLSTKSTLYALENLVIEFKDVTLIKDLKGNQLSTKRLESALPKLLYISDLQLKTITIGGSTIQQASLISIGLNLITAFLSGRALTIAWDFINAIQIMYYIPLIALYYPKFLKIVLSYFEFAMAEIELLFDIPYYDWLKGKIDSVLSIDDKPLNQTFNEFGISSTIIMVLYANKLVLWAVTAALYVPIKVASVGFSLLPFKGKAFMYVKGRVDELECGYRYNNTIRMMLELYLEMALFAFINVYSLNYTSIPNTIASILGIAFICIVTFLPSLLSIILSQNYHNISSKTFLSKYGAIIMGIRATQSRFVVLHFHSWFLYRRFMYVMILVFLRFWPQYQIYLCIFMNITNFMILIIFRPYYDKRQLWINFYNEIVVVVTFSMCSAYTLPSLTDSHSNIIAYTITTVLVVFCMVNIIGILIEAFKQVKLMVRSMCKKAKVEVKGVNQDFKYPNEQFSVNNSETTNRSIMQFLEYLERDPNIPMFTENIVQSQGVTKSVNSFGAASPGFVGGDVNRQFTPVQYVFNVHRNVHEESKERNKFIDIASGEYTRPRQ